MGSSRGGLEPFAGRIWPAGGTLGNPRLSDKDWWIEDV